MQQTRVERSSDRGEIPRACTVYVRGCRLLDLGVVDPGIRGAIDDVGWAMLFDESCHVSGAADIQLAVRRHDLDGFARENCLNRLSQHAPAAANPNLHALTRARKLAKDSAC